MSSSRSEERDQSSLGRRRRLVLLVSIFVIGACGLIYELVAGAAASYLMGDSVTQYSLVIGAFLAAMGLGSWITQWFERDLLGVFLRVQFSVGIIGGFSSLAMFAAFAHLDDIMLVVLGFTAVIGTLVGMEIPLTIRLLREGSTVRVAVAEVLTLDYFGALAACVAFPFLVLPLLGLVRAALAFGTMNILIGSFGSALFWKELSKNRQIAAWNVSAWGLVIIGWMFSNSTTSWLEDRLYQDEIVWAETTPYQRIVITRWRDDYRLHLNGHLQFSSRDEYRYHEALVLPAVGALLDDPGRTEPLDVLILGGGDGLAAQRVLATAAVNRIDLVDIDRRVVELFCDNPLLRQLNNGALLDARVKPHIQDAMVYLREAQSYDLILMDLPDPTSVETNRLYSQTFFGLALRRLKPRGVLATQASSPFYARKAYWCVVHTMEAAIKRWPSAKHEPTNRTEIIPYHVLVPSFGDWGFVLVAPNEIANAGITLPSTGQFLTDEVFAQARIFAPDSRELQTEINTLESPVLLRYHNEGWSQWGE